MAFTIPIGKNDWEDMFNNDQIWAGWTIDGYNIQSQMAIEGGVYVQRGAGLQPTTLPVYKSMIIPTIAFGIWNWLVDSFAASGVGKFFRLQPGIDNNPLRIDYAIGWKSEQAGQTVGQKAGPIPAPANTLPALGAYYRGLKNSLVDAYQYGREKFGEEVYRFRDTMKGTYNSPRYAYATATTRGSRRLDLTD